VAGWTVGNRGIGLAEVVSRVHPTILIGTSTHSGAFTEAIVKDMAAHTDRPIIMPLSNPTSKCEALPADLIEWTDGRVLTATGSPFGPVTYQDRNYDIAQANNALVFPGLGLGVIVAKASRISDRMIAAAADAVARLSDATKRGAPLLPPMTDLRTVSAAVAAAVATAAADEGLAQVELNDLVQQVHDAMWRPEYPQIELKWS
jgi:malate dehydrogenase (oxaloacetate-decarboxylating)